MRRIRFVDVANRREAQRQRVERLTRGFPPYRRERPRDPEEARYLRERGTPEHLIGPERETPLVPDADRGFPDEWRELILERLAPFEPAQIWVFGSRARGDARPASDVDLLVVVDDQDGRDLAAEMRAALRPFPVGVELFTATPDDLSRVGDSVGSFAYPVLREGRVIYGVDERNEHTWLRYAEEDLRAAERMTSERGWTPRLACFLAQQAAEKALKAVLVHEGLAPRYVHHLELLRDAIPEERSVRHVEFDAAQLSSWAVLPRYPGQKPDATPADAKQAAAWARELVEAARREIESPR